MADTVCQTICSAVIACACVVSSWNWGGSIQDGVALALTTWVSMYNWHLYKSSGNQSSASIRSLRQPCIVCVGGFTIRFSCKYSGVLMFQQ